MRLIPITISPVQQASVLPDGIVFDPDAAAHEGWTISDAGLLSDGSCSVQLQRIDCPEDGHPVFQDDCAAWAHVVVQARTGSQLHRQALTLVDKVERAVIEMTCGPW